MTKFDEIGGQAALEAIIGDFVDGCFDDVMIGFLFRAARRERVKQFEYQHAAAHLGAAVAYEGRPLRAAHGKHPILGGHFDRRLTILRETLDRHGVDASVRDAWLAHHQSLRSEITADPDSNCNHEAAERRIAETKSGLS